MQRDAVHKILTANGFRVVGRSDWVRDNHACRVHVWWNLDVQGDPHTFALIAGVSYRCNTMYDLATIACGWRRGVMIDGVMHDACRYWVKRARRWSAARHVTLASTDGNAAWFDAAGDVSLIDAFIDGDMPAGIFADWLSDRMEATR